MDILNYILPIELPLWIVVTMVYGVYGIINLEKMVKWRKFTVLSFAEIGTSTLLWGILGLIVMALTVFPIWLRIALIIRKARSSPE